MNALSEKLRRRVTALRPDWDPAGVSGFLHLEGGYSNHNYRFDRDGQRYVLRMPHCPRPFVDRYREQRLYQQADGHQMPEIVAFDPEDGAMISRWVPGRLLADLNPGPEALLSYLRNLHAAIPPLDREYDPLAQARLHLKGAAAPAWMEALASRLHWAPPLTVPSHNDLNPWNIIATPGGAWVTLDWEWAGCNDPLFDLVTLHQGSHLEEAALAGLASEYLGVPVTPERLHTCLSVFWLRETTWALAEMAAGNHRPEIAEQARLGTTRLKSLAERQP